ncbi:MAG: AMP-binding protein [Gemmatimonadales bacterium]
MTATMELSQANSDTTTIESVADIITQRLQLRAGRAVIRYDDGSSYRTVAGAEYFANLLRGIAILGGGDRQLVVGTFVRNRPEWDLLALASLYTGNILFPLDPKIDDDELVHLLANSPPDVMLVSRATRDRMIRLLATASGTRPTVVLADLYQVHDDAGWPQPATLAENEMLLSDVLPATFLPPASPLLDDHDTVLGHYPTSGTTSAPKVVRITHGNIVAQVNEGMDVMTLRQSEDLLNLGPYTHIATLLEFLVTKARGYTVTYFTREPDDDGVLEAEIRKLRKLGVKIRALMAVPKFWVFLLKEVLDEMRSKPIWHSLYRELTSIERHAQLHDMGTMDKAKLNAIRIFLRNRMGGHFTFGISSSTRIDPGVVAIFAKLGVTVIDIYGATEASGIVARNRLNASRPGSCGQMVSGLAYRIVAPRMIPGVATPVGLLELRGATLSRGYVGQPDGAHLDADGWYRTGDLGRIDADGWVYLVGREQELMPWPDGSLIDRMHLSNLLVRSIWVKDALVTRIADDPFVSVVLLPDQVRLDKDAGYRADLRAGISPAQALRTRLIEAIKWASSIAGTSAPLSTERIYLLSRPLLRTPTHKIRFVQELAQLDLTRWV